MSRPRSESGAILNCSSPNPNSDLGWAGRGQKFDWAGLNQNPLINNDKLLGIWIWARPILNWARPILNWAGNNSGQNHNYCYAHNIHLYIMYILYYVLCILCIHHILFCCKILILASPVLNWSSPEENSDLGRLKSEL